MFTGIFVFHVRGSFYLCQEYPLCLKTKEGHYKGIRYSGLGESKVRFSQRINEGKKNKKEGTEKDNSKGPLLQVNHILSRKIESGSRYFLDNRKICMGTSLT